MLRKFFFNVFCMTLGLCLFGCGSPTSDDILALGVDIKDSKFKDLVGKILKSDMYTYKIIPGKITQNGYVLSNFKILTEDGKDYLIAEHNNDGEKELIKQEISRFENKFYIEEAWGNSDHGDPYVVSSYDYAMYQGEYAIIEDGKLNDHKLKENPFRAKEAIQTYNSLRGDKKIFTARIKSYIGYSYAKVSRIADGVDQSCSIILDNKEEMEIFLNSFPKIKSKGYLMGAIDPKLFNGASEMRILASFSIKIIAGADTEYASPIMFVDDITVIPLEK